MVRKVTIHAVGDIVPSKGRGEFLLAQAAPVIKKADIAFCQLEVAFSERSVPRAA